MCAMMFYANGRCVSGNSIERGQINIVAVRQCCATIVATWLFLFLVNKKRRGATYCCRGATCCRSAPILIVAYLVCCAMISNGKMREYFRCGEDFATIPAVLIGRSRCRNRNLCATIWRKCGYLCGWFLGYIRPVF